MRRCRYARSWPQSQSSRKQCKISRVDNIIPDVLQPSSSSTSCSGLAFFVTCLLDFSVVVDWNTSCCLRNTNERTKQRTITREILCIDDCKITSFIWVWGHVTCRHFVDYRFLWPGWIGDLCMMLFWAVSCSCNVSWFLLFIVSTAWFCHDLTHLMLNACTGSREMTCWSSFLGE